ncbi:MAG: hypothetical protein JST30_08105 [Armatimonadetes bacterium]|nr:hypothetical protein [Armatimonadota bacterium]
MSNVAERIDARENLVQWLAGLKGMYIADLNAMPEATITESSGGVARPVNVLTGDAIGMCKWMSGVLRGETPTMSEGDSEAFRSLTTKDQVVAAFTEAVDELSAALSAADEATLTKTVMAPWQMESTVFMLATIAVNHIWYHDGQLNLIQALNGDGDVHWMG